MNIELLKRDEIDDKRWNGCVHFAINAMPYAYTWYLDNICEEWEGLVLGKYRAVMPLVFNIKFSFHYLFQPYFAQQLGVFTDVQLTKEKIDAFLSAIPEKYKYIDIQLNSSNPAPSNFEVETRDNYLLEMKMNYESIRENYSGNLKRNIAKAEKEGLKFNNQLKPEPFVDFYMQHTAPKLKNFDAKNKHTMLRIIYQCMHYGMGGVVGIYKDEKLVAANFLIHHPQRTINLLPTSSEEGKKLGAMHFLMDTIIRIGAGQNKYLDFEGSMIKGVADFYESFGAKKSSYLRVKRNNLPILARIFKR
jgi:hypothetical protein